MKSSLKSLLAFLLSFCLVCALNWGQSKDTSSLDGNVIDSSGSPLPGAAVRISSPNMLGGDQNKITDGEGKFRFVGLLPGAYMIEATLQGFVTAKKEGIGLHMGQTLTVTLTMEVASLSEEVIVEGVAPLIDIKDSAMGITTLDTEFLDNVPNSSRRTSAMVNQAPGVWSNQGFGGRSRTGNSYTIDGVETRYPRTGEDWSMVDFNIFQEMQVLGLGASAQYDGFSGIVQNSITKSGGNTFHGHAEVIYMDWGWQSKNFDPAQELYSLYQAPPKRRNYIGAFSIGGPFIKDKLWFFAAGKFSSDQTEIAGMSDISNLKQPTGFLKLSYQPTSKLRISGFFESDFYINSRYGLSISNPPETTYDNVGPTYMGNLSAFYTLSDQTFMEVKGLAYVAPQNMHPQMGMNISGHIDDRTGMYSVNTPDYYFSEADRFQVAATLSHHADDFIKGSHDFKVGVDYEALPAFDEFGYTNGFLYRDNVYSFDDHLYHNYAYSYMYRTEVTSNRFSVFAEDSWELLDNLTINPGVRLNVHRGILRRNDQTVYKTSNVLPRLGLTWDVFGNHSTALKLHYGQYSDGMKNNYFQRADPGQEDFVMYEVLPDQTKVELYRVQLSIPAVIDPDIKHPVMHQFTAGIERELARDLSFGTTFIWRKWDNLIARVNSTAQWNPVSFTFTDNTGASQTIQVYNKTTPPSADQFLITNAKAGEYSVIVDPKSSYWGLMFTLTKRFSSNWMMFASYIYSKLAGTEQGGSTGSEQAAPPWLDPNMQINLDGRLEGDFTHQFKLYSAFTLPMGFNLSASFQYVTSPPWARTIKAPVSGAPVIMIEPLKPDQRYKPLINADMRLEKAFMIGRTSLGLQLDVFNLFNYGYPTSIERRIDRATFGLATRVSSGRQIRLGLRFMY